MHLNVIDILFSVVMILRKLVNIMVLVKPEITQSCLPGVAEIRDRLQLRGLDWTPAWCLAWWPTLCVVSGIDALTCLIHCSWISLIYFLYGNLLHPSRSEVDIVLYL